MKFFGKTKRVRRPAAIGSIYALLAYLDLSNIFSGSGTSQTLQDTTNDATEKIVLKLDRTRTGVANDILAAFAFVGRSTTAVARNFIKMRAKILDPTNASEDGQGVLSALVAGADTPIITFGPGVQIGAPTGGDKGLETLNVGGGIYQDGVLLSSGPKLNQIIYYTAGGTYNKPGNLSFIEIEGVAGGGGGGGANGTQVGVLGIAGGGGAGGYFRKTIQAASLGASETVTIGAGGAGGVAGDNPGSSGGSTSFGAHASATGGGGGSGATAAVGSVNVVENAGDGGTASTGDINSMGQRGENGVVLENTKGFGGRGGVSFFGGGRSDITTVQAPGAGGAGAAVTSTSDDAGGAGGGGLIILYEYTT